MTNFVRDNLSLRPAKSDFQTQSAVPSDRKVAAVDWNELRQSLVDIQSYLRADFAVNVKNYGATGDGVTDDTAAIQAAIDAAATLGGNAHGVVTFFPASATPYMFSNLKLPAYTVLQGTRIAQCQLKRIPGSTGNAIQEKTAAEGNANGALSIWIRDLGILGNGTVGNGIDLGYQVVGKNFETWASLENVLVQDFTSGVGFHLNCNAISLKYIYALANQDGVHITGAYSQFHTVYGEQNTRYQIRAAGTANAFFGVHCEMGASVDPAILIEGGSHSFNGVTIYSSAAAPRVIEIATTSTKNQLHDVYFFHDGVPFIHGIYSVDFANARTGTVPYIQHFEMGDSAVASWYVNVDTGNVQKRIGNVYRFEGQIDANGRLGGGDVVSAVNQINGQTQSNSGVNIAMSGQYDGTAAAREPSGVKSFVTATRSAGAFNQINRSGWFSASGAQSNRAVQTDDGDNFFNVNSGGSLFHRALRCTNELAPAQITANQNDYEPAGFADAFLLLLTSDAARDVTGFGIVNNKLLYVYNNGSFNITLKNQVTSTATKQIVGRGAADTVLTPKTGVLLYYSVLVGSGKWIVLGDTL